MEDEAALYPFLKWVTDKLVALVLIVLFSPVFILIVLIMAVSMLLRPADRGAWLYRERRVSRGREFDLLKFRVLREDIIARMPPADRHARLYEKDPLNLTWVGHRLLKRWYFDELPQLFNILKGDMSLVGPRPWPVSLVDAQVKRGVVYRNLIRAGWTGPAQLQKRKKRPNSPPSRSAEELDLEYFDRCNNWPSGRLWLYDIRVLCQTVSVMLEGEGLKN